MEEVRFDQKQSKYRAQKDEIPGMCQGSAALGTNSGPCARYTSTLPLSCIPSTKHNFFRR